MHSIRSSPSKIARPGPADAAGTYFHSDFTADWKLDGDRVTVTQKLFEPVTYQLSGDGSSLFRKDYDEEHGLDMVVTFTRNQS